MDLGAAIETLRGLPDAVVLAVLFGGSFIEYVVPPIPGDTIVVAGTVLVAAFGWHWAPILAVVTLGAIAGAVADFAIGRWLVRSGRVDRMGEGTRKTIDKVVAQMKKRGAVYLAVNRFLPGIRAFFFIAAGIAELRFWKVILWSTLSALAWNIMLVAIGFAVGKNVDDLELFLTRFSFVGWGFIAALVIFFVVKWFRSNRAKASRSRTEAPDRKSPPQID